MPMGFYHKGKKIMFTSGRQNMEIKVWFIQLWRRGGLIVSALNAGPRGLGLSTRRGHCVVFLDKTLYSDTASHHPGVQMGTNEFNAGDNPAMDQHPIQGELKYPSRLMLHLAHMQTLPSYGHTKQINSRIIQESKNRLNRNEKLTALDGRTAGLFK